MVLTFFTNNFNYTFVNTFLLHIKDCKYTNLNTQIFIFFFTTGSSRSSLTTSTH